MQDEKKKEGEQNTALATKETMVMSFNETENLGDMFVRSGYFKDAKDKAQAFVKIMAGREMGVPPITAMMGIYWFNDKMTLSANLMAAVVKKSGRYNYRVVKHNEKECEIEFTENGVVSGSSSFTMDDAAKAGITGNVVWKKYPRNMLYARAMSNGVKWYCPDLFGGSPVYVPEEMGAQVDGEGNPIKVIDVPTTQPKVVEQKEPSKPQPFVGESEPSSKSYELQESQINEGPMYDSPIPFPADRVKGMNPRDAWAKMSEWYYQKNRRDELVKILDKVCPEAQANYQIPESALVKMIKDLTGVELEMVEEIAKCSECKELIPQPECDTLKGLCQKCHDKKVAQ